METNHLVEGRSRPGQPRFLHGFSRIGWALTIGSVALIACIYVLASQNASQRKELAEARDQVAEVEKLRESAQELQRVRSQGVEVERLRQDAQEVHRLRNEVRQLREDAKTALTLQSENQQLKTALQQALAQSTAVKAEKAQLEQALQGQRQLTELQVQAQAANRAVAIVNVCINNLRQLDGATEQWALENKKVQGSPIVADEVARYIRGNAIPVCPGGGAYGLTTVGTAPTCTIPGHALQQ